MTGSETSACRGGAGIQPAKCSCRYFLIGLTLAAFFALSLNAQEPAIVVDAKPLVTPQPPTRVAGEFFVPLGPIARALGAGISVGQDQTVRVRRADGAIVTFDGRTGEIRSGAVLVGQVPNYRLIRIAAEADQLLFPL